MSLKAVLLIPIFISLNVFAQVPQPSALGFKSWKEQQVLDAQNQVLRISAHISQLKSGKVSSSGSTAFEDLPSERVRKSSESELTLSERDLKHAQENLTSANGLKFEDYVSVYIPTLQDQPEALSKLIEKLSKEELVEVIKSLIKRPSDAKHKASFPQELRGSSQAQR